jgi:hypothetical protein
MAKEIEWSDVKISINGVLVTKARGCTYQPAQEKEHLHAAGTEPISIQRGNRTYTGTLSLLKGQVDTLNRAVIAAGGKDLLDATFVIVIEYPGQGDRLPQIDTLTGCEFTELPKAIQQNEKFMQIDLPFLALNLQST